MQHRYKHGHPRFLRPWSSFKNHKGEILAACTWFIMGDKNPTSAEAMTINKSIEVAFELCFKKVVFETDNKTIALMMNDEKSRETLLE